MKRSTSRASKAMADGQETEESPLPGLTKAKWNELIDKEENMMFLLGLREEIIHNTMKFCYENYLQRQAVSFAVHCAYLAWLKVIGIFYMFKDPGDGDDFKTVRSWEPDEEPEPSTIDSWASQCIKPVKSEPVKKEKEVFPENLSPPKLTQEMKSLTRCSSMCYEGEEELYYPASFSDFRAQFSTKEKSVFSRTLSMSKESLLLVEPSTVHDCKNLVKSKKDKKKISNKVKHK